MSNPVHASFGIWLKQHRKEAGITTDDLAEKAACSSVTLRKIESGERRPSRQIALSIAELFHVPADEQEAFVTFARTLSPRDPDSILSNSTPLHSQPETDANEQGEEQAQAHSPWRAVHLSKSNLPLALTSFIGREHELDEVCSRLRQPKVRLLSMTGPPGTGKTRMAIEVAASLLGDFEDGVYLVELAPLSDPDMVIPSIARALNLREIGGQSIEDTLITYLKDKRILLVLDNFEQVLDAGPEVVKLVQASPWLKVLVTSREVLHVRGERQYPVPALRLPALADKPSLEELSQNPAVELFVERAEDADAGFTLTEENALEVAEVCINLDGLPLAIELAAARVSLFPPRTLLSSLGRQLQVLRGGSRDLPPRQRTLRSAIDWSYDLLDEEHQQLFRKMAVFQGGRTLQGLEEVCNSANLEAKGRKLKVGVLDGVEKLLSSNLLQQREGRKGEARYWMLETIHEYAREKLEESGEAQALKREHALYFMRLAEEAEPHLTSEKQQEWLDRLEDEYDNIRAALWWTSEQPSAEAVEAGEVRLRTAGAIWRFWYMRGLLTEGREHLERIISASEARRQGCSLNASGTSNSMVMVKALSGAGGLALTQGDFPAARSLVEAAVVMGGELGDKQGMASSLNTLGIMAYQQGDLKAARALYEGSLALGRELGEKWRIATSLGNLGIVTFAQGDYPAARALHEESLAIKRELGDKHGISYSAGNLGMLAIEQGDYPAARALYEECLALRRELGDKHGISRSLANLGNLACVQGDYPAARALYEGSLALATELRDKSGIATSLGNLGNLACVQGDYPAARALYEESLALRRELGDKMGSAVCLAGLGGVAVGVGQVERGVRLLGAAEELLQSMGSMLDREDRMPNERAVVSARTLLGEETFETAWQEGRVMSMEQAIQYALESVSAS